MGPRVTCVSLLSRERRSNAEFKEKERSGHRITECSAGGRRTSSHGHIGPSIQNRHPRKRAAVKLSDAPCQKRFYLYRISRPTTTKGSDPTMPKAVKLSQSARHGKKARKPGNPAGSGGSAPVHVTLTSKKKMSCRTVEKTLHVSTEGDYIVDCETLPTMELRRRYRAEANTHRNMLSRQKSDGAVIHPEFPQVPQFPTTRRASSRPRCNARQDRQLRPGIWPR